MIPVEGATCAAHEFHKQHKKFKPVPQTAPQKSVGECYSVEVAFASDFALFQEFGSVAAVETWVLGILNNVQSNFDDDFADEIQFQLVGQFVSTCSTCDPWTSANNAETLLNSFGDWANTGGFGFDFDLAGLWTNRDIFTTNSGSGVIGVAWPGSLCTSLKYTVLENFSSNAGALRTLVAHEFGHNFSASHDAPGNNSIMAPSLTVTNNWSDQSFNQISNYIDNIANAFNCFGACSVGSAPPQADFSANVLQGCAPLTVSFQDQSIGIVNNYLWNFPGGTPTTSTEPNPTITYNTPGIYDVSLQVSNADGNDVLTQSNYIIVEASPVAQFGTMIDGLEVTFQNQSTNAFSYIWDFGDGQVSFEENPTHTYASDGTYNVTLSVTNGCATVTTSAIITVVTPPSANFTAEQTEGCLPFEVSLTNLSSANATSFFLDL